MVFSLLSACDESTAPLLLGIATTGETFEIHYAVCAGSYVERVRVILRHGDDPYDGDDQTLWEIRAEGPTDATEFEPGITPTGYREIVPYRGDPEGDVVVQVEEDSGIRPGIGFTHSDLEEGWILRENELVRPNAFFAEAGEVCDS